MNEDVSRRIADGRTDLVFDWIANGHPAAAADPDGVPLIRWSAYYGDVSAVRYLIANGALLGSLGKNYDLNGAVYHGHWQLVQYLIESGADVNEADPDTGETPLHSALCKVDRPNDELVLEVLLGHGANPNCTTNPNVETGAFMRDCRTKAETPLHRAAAFGSAKSVQRLLDAGATIDAQDMNGETPLSWASWHLRPDPILRLLCYGRFTIRPDREPMSRGRPHLR